MEMVIEFISNLSKDIGGHWAPRSSQWRLFSSSCLSQTGPASSGSRLHRMAGALHTIRLTAGYGHGPILTSEEAALATTEEPASGGGR
jgi:hypothetical protein